MARVTLTVLLLALCPPAVAQGNTAEAKKLYDLAMAKAKEARESKKGKVREQLYLDVVALMRQIAKDHPDTRFYGIAQYNAGSFLADYLENREDEAIKQFKALIRSKVDDKDPTGSLMRPFRNYRHHAWSRIAIIRDKQERLGLAMNALLCMRRAYVIHCGTCSASMESEALARIQFLGLRLIHGKKAMQSDETEEGEGEETLKKEVKEADRKLLAELAKLPAIEGGDDLLWRLVQRLHQAGRRVQASRVLRVLLEDFPGTEHLAQAQKLATKFGFKKKK